MRKIVYLLALALMVPAFAAAQSRWDLTKNGTWKGVVVEQSCYKKDGFDKASAAEHNACALDCLKKGQPLGIMTDDDGYMQITGTLSKDNYAKLTQWIGKRVSIAGDSARDAFSARYVDVTKIAATK